MANQYHYLLQDPKTVPEAQTARQVLKNYNRMLSSCFHCALHKVWQGSAADNAEIALAKAIGNDLPNEPVK